MNTEVERLHSISTKQDHVRAHAGEILDRGCIKTTLVFAKTTSWLLRDAIRRFEAPGSNGYEMGTAEKV